MAAAIALRDDFDGPALRRLAKGTKDAAQARRLLALAEIRDGGTRADAARVGGVGLQEPVRDWVLRFNARGPAGLIEDGKAPGNPSKLDDAQRRALADIVERSRSGHSRSGAVAAGRSRDGSGRSSASRSARPRSRVAGAGVSQDLGTPSPLTQTNWRSMLLKKPSGRTRHPREAPGRNRNRAVVADEARVGQELHHPPLGQAWNPAARPS